MTVILATFFAPGFASALEFVNAELWLGTVSNNSDVMVKFEIKNLSIKPIKVISAEASCRCTALKKEVSEIAGSATTTFEWDFNTSRADGLSEQIVTVETEGGGLVTGKFHAWVEPLAGVMATSAFIAMKVGETSATTTFSIVGLPEILSPGKIRFPDNVTASTQSELLSVPGFPGLRKIDYQISVRSGASEKIIIWQHDKRRLEIPLSIILLKP